MKTMKITTTFTAIVCLLFTVGLLTMAPVSATASNTTESTQLNSDTIKFKISGSNELGEKLMSVNLDWTKLSKRDQREFKASLKKLSKELKKTNKESRKEIGTEIFSKKLIRKVERFAKNPKKLTPHKITDLTKEIFQSVMAVFPSIFNTQLGSHKGIFNNIENHFENIEKHFEDVENHFENVESHFENIEKHFENLEDM